MVTPKRAMEIARMPFGPEWAKLYDEACRELRAAEGLDISDVSGVCCEDGCPLVDRCPLLLAEDERSGGQS